MNEGHEDRIRELELKQAEYNIIIPQLIKSVDELTKAVTALNGYVATAKGGWKMMLGVGAAIAGLVEVLKSVWPHS